jgi:hypothetical protein
MFQKSPGVDLQAHRHASLTSCREPLSRQESLRECNLVPPPPAPITLLTASQSSTISFSPPSGPSSPYSTIRSLNPSTQSTSPSHLRLRTKTQSPHPRSCPKKKMIHTVDIQPPHPKLQNNVIPPCPGGLGIICGNDQQKSMSRSL